MVLPLQFFLLAGFLINLSEKLESFPPLIRSSRFLRKTALSSSSLRPPAPVPMPATSARRPRAPRTSETSPPCARLTGFSRNNNRRGSGRTLFQASSPNLVLLPLLPSLSLPPPSPPSLFPLFPSTEWLLAESVSWPPSSSFEISILDPGFRHTHSPATL